MSLTKHQVAVFPDILDDPRQQRDEQDIFHGVNIHHGHYLEKEQVN